MSAKTDIFYANNALWNGATENENNALSLPHEYSINKRVYIYLYLIIRREGEKESEAKKLFINLNQTAQ